LQQDSGARLRVRVSKPGELSAIFRDLGWLPPLADAHLTPSDFLQVRRKALGNFRLRLLLLLAGLACALTWTGCSSSSAISITLTPPSASAITINQGQSQAIAASVANDISNGGVTWSLSGGGTLLNPSKTSVTYQAPASLASDITASITATSVADSTITAGLAITVDAVLSIVTTSLPVGSQDVPYFGVINAGGATGPFTWTLQTGSLPPGLTLSSSTTDSIVVSGTPTALGTSKFTMQVTDSTGTVATQALSITINPPPPLSVATKLLSPGTVGVNYSQTLQAASGTPPYTWQITAGSLPAGLALNNSAGVISGVPTTVQVSSFTVEVTDSSVPTQQTASAILSITIKPSTVNNAELNGTYAFLVSGFSPNGHFVAAGSFVADGAGDIASGVIDTNDPASLQLAQGFTGSYAIGSSNLGTMTLGTAPPRSFALSMMANGNAKIIEFDDKTGTGTRNAGVLLKQSTSAFTAGQILGNYALGFSGTDASGARYAFEGAMSADGVSHFSGGLLDSNDAGVTQNNVGFTGTFSGISAANGRGTATISIAGQGTTSYSFYIVSATQLLVMEIDQVNGQTSPIVSGSMLQQSGPALNGTGVLETSAISGGLTQSQVGAFTGNGGNFTVSTDENTGSTLSQPLCSGTYSSIGSNGRTTLTYSGTACAESVIYLVSANQGFVMGTDANVTFGSMENQSGGPFMPSSLSGTYAGGSLAAVLPGAGTQVDIEVADGIGAVSYTTDISNSTGLTQNQQTSGTFSLPVNQSRGTVTVNSSVTEIFYMVSPTEFVSLFTDADATIEHFQQ
jgi:putative Ig domain-containing protein